MPHTPRQRSKRLEPMDVGDTSESHDSSTIQSTYESSPLSFTSSKSSWWGSDAPSECSDASPKSRRRLQPAPALSTQEKGSFVRPRGRAPRRSHIAPGPLSDDKDCLFNLMKQDSISLRTIAAHWLQFYQKDNISAIAKLLEFYLHASGRDLPLTAEMINEPEVTIKSIENTFKDDCKAFPLVLKAHPWPTFTSNFIHFIRVLFLQCKNSIIYDDFLIPTLRVYLADISNLPIRPLRYTSTLVLIKLITVLQEIDQYVREARDTTRRQLQTEREKSEDKRSSDIIESLRAKQNDLFENRKELNTLMDDLLKSVFVPRSTDMLPEIRCLCLDELGIWLDVRPIKFYNSIKYIGYGLVDKSPEIRLQSLKILQSLYLSENLNDEIRQFNEQHKERIVQMPLDKDTCVAIESVKLMGIIYQNHKDMLNESDYETVYQLVLCKDRNLAQTSGEFLMGICSTDDAQSQSSDGMIKSNDSLLKQLVDFFFELERPQNAGYLVDALIDKHEIVQNWECMTDFLLGDPEEDVNGNKLLSLVKLMVVSIEQSATGKFPPGRGFRKKVFSAGEQRKVAFDREKLTTHFINFLPRLLIKYKTDSRILALLLKIPQYFYLDMYVKTHQEKKLCDFLDEMRKIVDNSVDIDTLRATSQTLEFLCTQDHPKLEQCKTQRSLILDDIIQRYEETMDTYDNLIKGGEIPDEEEIMDVVQSFRKITAFSRCHDMNHCHLYDSFYKIIKSVESPSNKIPDEGIICGMQICYDSLIWKRSVLDSLDSHNDSSEDVARALKDLLDRFIKAMKFCVENAALDLTIREEAYKSICDLLLIFNKSLAKDSNPLLHNIIYEPDDDLREALNAFVQKYVFIHESHEKSNSDDFYRRRNLLMGFCRLVICNVFRVRSATDIFKHYDDFYNDYGDIIKMTLVKAKEINKTNWALTMQLSLSILFDEARETVEGRIVDADMVGMVNLAKRFAILLGFDTTKNKAEVLAIHFAGINFIVAVPAGEELPSTNIPPKISYLEVLTEFSGKLSKEGKKEILSVLDNKLPLMASQGSEWTALLKYRKSLMGGRRGAEGTELVQAREEQEKDATGEPDGTTIRGKRKPKIKKPSLNVKKMRGSRARVTEGETPEVHSVSQDINDRLNRIGVYEHDHSDAMEDEDEWETVDESMEVN